MNRKISIVIPVHDLESRWQYIKKSIDLAEHDDRISEIILNCEPGNKIMIDRPKVRTFHNEKREYVFRNKYKAVESARNEWVILLDSDNIIDKSYIDTLFSVTYWNEKVIYQPEYARPNFDFRKFSGVLFDSSTAKTCMNEPMFRVMLNAMNYFVNREKFLFVNQSTFESEFDPKCADSLQINYNFLKNGCSIHVLKGLQYEHTVHVGSFYKESAGEYGHLTKTIEDRIKAL